MSNSWWCSLVPHLCHGQFIRGPYSEAAAAAAACRRGRWSTTRGVLSVSWSTGVARACSARWRVVCGFVSACLDSLRHSASTCRPENETQTREEIVTHTKNQLCFDFSGKQHSLPVVQRLRTRAQHFFKFCFRFLSRFPFHISPRIDALHLKQIALFSTPVMCVQDT